MKSLLWLVSLLSSISRYDLLVSAQENTDPCAKLRYKEFMLPADALACLKSFPFNDTIRNNVLDNVERVMDFYTYESYYSASPPPFEDSTTDIRGELAKFRTATYETDYDFHKALERYTNQLNDGHTRYYPLCYAAFHNVLPAPMVTFNENGTDNIYIVPNLVEFVPLVGDQYTEILDEELKFDYRRLAGARVLEIEGKEAWEYIDHIATTESGNYLDHEIRVNAALASYRIEVLGTWSRYSQRIGDMANPPHVEQTSLQVKLIPANSTEPETVDIPFVAQFVGNTYFENSSDYREFMCDVNDGTNGVDLRDLPSSRRTPRLPKADMYDASLIKAVEIPDSGYPSLPVLGAHGSTKTYMLPDKKTAVMFLGTFAPRYPVSWGFDVSTDFKEVKDLGASRLIIDMTNNPGGYVCLGQYFLQYLVGTKNGPVVFESSMRGNALSQKLAAANAAVGKDLGTFYHPGYWRFVNGTTIPADYNHAAPPVPFEINGKSDPQSQRFLDHCEAWYKDTDQQPFPEEPVFDLSKVIIVNNGACASTCAMFTTMAQEKFNIAIAVFGGRADRPIEYKGMAGNQVLEWRDIHTELLTVDLDKDELAPPPLMINSLVRHNWRTAWSTKDKNVPIAYKSAQPNYRFPYTRETYMYPQKLWEWTANRFFD